jgi:hypothetical protein
MMKKLLFTIILAFLMIGCLESTGTISGRITDSAGNPVTGASILLNPLGLTTSSDTNGFYTVNNVPWGDYTVTASSGQLSNSVNVKVVNKSSLSCEDINLNPNTLVVVDIQLGGGNVPSNPKLTVNVNPYGAAAVTLDPPGGIYVKGTTVTVTVVPGEGYTFSNWYDDASGTDNPLTLLISSDVSIIANLSNVLQGPIAYYKFNENTGTIAHDSAGTSDASITDATWTTGKSTAGVALSFDGNASVETLNPIMTLDRTTPYTYEIWFRVDRGGNYISFYLISPVLVDGKTGSDLYLLEGIYAVGVLEERSSGLSNGRVYIPEHGQRPTLSYGVWYFVALTSDGNTLSIYQDGQLIASKAIPQELNGSPCAAPFIFGDTINRGPLSEAPLYGAIDEIKIYNRALSGVEILQSYQAGPADN